jgi:hypothetical protein
MGHVISNRQLSKLIGRKIVRLAPISLIHKTHADRYPRNVGSLTTGSTDAHSVRKAVPRLTASARKTFTKIVLSFHLKTRNCAKPANPNIT